MKRTTPRPQSPTPICTAAGRVSPIPSRGRFCNFCQTKFSLCSCKTCVSPHERRRRMNSVSTTFTKTSNVMHGPSHRPTRRPLATTTKTSTNTTTQHLPSHDNVPHPNMSSILCVSEVPTFASQVGDVKEDSLDRVLEEEDPIVANIFAPFFAAEFTTHPTRLENLTHGVLNAAIKLLSTNPDPNTVASILSLATKMHDALTPAAHHDTPLKDNPLLRALSEHMELSKLSRINIIERWILPPFQDFDRAKAVIPSHWHEDDGPGKHFLCMLESIPVAPTDAHKMELLKAVLIEGRSTNHTSDDTLLNKRKKLEPG